MSTYLGIICSLRSWIAFSSSIWIIYQRKGFVYSGKDLLFIFNISYLQILNRILSRALPNLERDESTAYQHRFHHLIPYGSKYYSYLVAKASASLIWRNHFQVWMRKYDSEKIFHSRLIHTIEKLEKSGQRYERNEGLLKKVLYL